MSLIEKIIAFAQPPTNTTSIPLASVVNNLYTDITAVAWSIFLLAWGVGWALRGSPIPIFRIKKGGQDILEDAVIATFFLAIGSTIFDFIRYYLASHI